MTNGWETIVGLEVHAELSTKTKMFCACANEFGGEPNTNVCPVCAGLPGSLPVLNERAVELAMKIGLALECTISKNVFSRKNYFYPDMPKNYQVSQYDLPINVDGQLKLPSGKVIGIERAHLEEDTGKNTHKGGTGRILGSEYSLVDYNRSGVPLIEIVSRPDMRNSEEAKEYVSELRSILVAIGASDGKMEEGSLRVDANVSVRKQGDPLGTRCEVKNVNSLRSLSRAIEYEANRQIALLESGDVVEQQTRHWSEDEGKTTFGRVKEEAYDYRYFPEPDLALVDPDRQWLETIASTMPLLPRQRREAISALSDELSDEAIATVVELNLDHFVLSAAEKGLSSKIALNRASNELASDVMGASSIKADHFCDLVRMEESGELTVTQAKQVAAEMLVSDSSPSQIASSKGFEALSDDKLAVIVKGVLEENPKELEALKQGNNKLIGFFTGKVMAATKGNADGKKVAKLLNEQVNS